MHFRDKSKSGIFPLLFILLAYYPLNVFAAQWKAEHQLQFSVDMCQKWESFDELKLAGPLKTADKSTIEFRGQAIGSRYRLAPESDVVIELEVVQPPGRDPRFISKQYDASGNSVLLISLASDCSQQVVRRVNYNRQKQQYSLVSLDKNMVEIGEPDLLNPHLKFLSIKENTGQLLKQLPPVLVGMIDSGVNYLLPEINQRLARDSSGRLIGFDFWDMDGLPFDANLVTSGFFVQRHGTRTASLLLEEGPHIQLVAYRYPRPDMSRMKDLIKHAAAHDVSIIGMPLGSNRAEEWVTFEKTARDHPEILFIVSAGNNGRDIDQYPVYPATLDLPNMIVVSSSDDYVRPADRTNWGVQSVDYLIPAEGINVMDYSGKRRLVSGSSYAVSRMAALAAHILTAHRHWHAPQIIEEINRRYSVSSEGINKWVKVGYIPDPLARAAIQKKPVSNLEYSEHGSGDELLLSIEVLSLDERWDKSVIEKHIRRARDILKQCDIVIDKVSIFRVTGEDYLKDLSTGTAHTLLSETQSQKPTLVLARDTRMQTAYMGEAFGLGNTSNRPWLSNSVWLIWDVDDAGVAIAHELYHVLANNGVHVDLEANLMQGETRPDGINLTPEQCDTARGNGLENKLLRINPGSLN